jgi:hypothetical protein
MNTRAKIEALRHEASKLTTDLVLEEKRISELQRQLTDKLSRAAKRKMEITNEIQALQEQIRKQEAEQHVVAFLKVAADLDKHGESPERIAEWNHLAAQLRTDGKLGQSHYSVALTTGRLRGLERGYGPLPAALRTWSATARNWVKQPEAA